MIKQTVKTKKSISQLFTSILLYHRRQHKELKKMGLLLWFALFKGDGQILGYCNCTFSKSLSQKEIFCFSFYDVWFLNMLVFREVSQRETAQLTLTNPLWNFTFLCFLTFFTESTFLMLQINCILNDYPQCKKKIAAYALSILTWRSLHIKLSFRLWFFRPNHTTSFSQRSGFPSLIILCGSPLNCPSFPHPSLEEVPEQLIGA